MAEPKFPPLALTLGATEICTMISSLLYGVASVQVYLYAVSTKKRPVIVTWIVAFVALVETIHLIITWEYFFEISVTHFGDPGSIVFTTWQSGTVVGLHALVSTTIQLFFCYRIWVLSRRSVWVVVLPLLETIVRCALNFVLVVFVIKEGVEVFHDSSRIILVYVITILSALSDIYIAVSLCILLWRQKTGYQSTVKIVNNIIIWTIETGIITATTAVLILIFFVALPETAIWNGLLVIYPRLYAISFLVSLGNTTQPKPSQGSRVTTVNVESVNFAPRSDSTGTSANQSHFELSHYSHAGRPQAQEIVDSKEMAKAFEGALDPLAADQEQLDHKLREGQSLSEVRSIC